MSKFWHRNFLSLRAPAGAWQSQAILAGSQLSPQFTFICIFGKFFKQQATLAPSYAQIIFELPSFSKLSEGTADSLPLALWSFSERGKLRCKIGAK